MPKPRPVVATDEKIAETTSQVEKLLDAILHDAHDEGRQGAQRSPDEASPREMLLELVKSLAARATYRVFVTTMRETHRVTYWTTVVSSNQSTGGRDWHKGRITPFMSENLEYALYEASNWAAFLGVEAEPWVKPEWHDELVAQFEAERLAAGKSGSGSNPQVGARLTAYAEEEAKRLAQGATTDAR